MSRRSLQLNRLLLRLPLSGQRLALLFSVMLGILVVFIQPAARWWLTIDCDGTYLGSTPNLYAGTPTEYFDHPGLPLQVLLALTVAADHAVHSIGMPMSRYEYVDRVRSDMGSALWMIRGWAAVFLLMGVCSAHQIGRRWCGHWSWGILAAILYVAAIGHSGRAVMFRPDNVLSALCLIVTFLVIRACQREAVHLHLLAVFILGLAITIKVHAVGLVPMAAIGLVLLRHRNWMDDTLGILRSLWREQRRVLLLALILLVLIVGVTNSWRPAPVLEMRAVIAMGLIACYLVVSCLAWRAKRCGWPARSVLHLMWPLSIVVLGAGIVLPGIVFLDELVMMLRYLLYAVTGRGVNRGFDAAGILIALFDQWRKPALLMQIPLVIMAIIGAWRQVRSGNRTAILWLVAAGSMFGLAAMRAAVHPSAHHYGPAIALCIPLILSAIVPLKRSEATQSGNERAECCPSPAAISVRPSLPAVVLVAAIAACPIVTAAQAAWSNRARCDVLADVTRRLSERLGTGEYIMTDYWAQNAESGYFMQVRDWCNYTPERHYRSLPDTPTALRYAAAVNMRPAYYLTSGEKRTGIRVTPSGRLIARSVWANEWYVEQLEIHNLPNITISVFAVVGAVEDLDHSRVASAVSLP